MHTDLPFVLVAPGHPSLDGAIERFCERLRAETRWFGRRGADCPKPAPSLIRRLASHEPGIRLAAVVDGEIIGLARIDVGAAAPELLVAVDATWRRRGVALALGRAVVARAHDAGFERIVLRTSERGDRLRELAAALGFEVVDLGQGLDLIRVLPPACRSA
jgi:GNAT superfamily N-acetyltransferase